MDPFSLVTVTEGEFTDQRRPLLLLGGRIWGLWVWVVTGANKASLFFPALSQAGPTGEGGCGPGRYRLIRGPRTESLLTLTQKLSFLHSCKLIIR